MSIHRRTQIPTLGLILGLLISLTAVLPAQAASSDLAGAKQHVETLGRSALASLQAPHLTPADREAMLATILQKGVAIDQIGFSELPPAFLEARVDGEGS